MAVWGLAKTNTQFETAQVPLMQAFLRVAETMNAHAVANTV
jgi:hypothetical protein